MHSRRLLAPGSEGKPIWVCLYVRPIGEQWAATIVADDAPPPEPGSLNGVTFFGDTAEEAERLAVAYPGEGVPQNEGEDRR
jgi:hypothetical protein